MTVRALFSMGVNVLGGIYIYIYIYIYIFFFFFLGGGE